MLEVTASGVKLCVLASPNILQFRTIGKWHLVLLHQQNIIALFKKGNLPILCVCLLQHLDSTPVWRSNADPWKVDRVDAIDFKAPTF